MLPDQIGVGGFVGIISAYLLDENGFVLLDQNGQPLLAQ